MWSLHYVPRAHFLLVWVTWFLIIRLDQFPGGFLFYIWCYGLGDQWIQKLLIAGEKVIRNIILTSYRKGSYFLLIWRGSWRSQSIAECLGDGCLISWLCAILDYSLYFAFAKLFIWRAKAFGTLHWTCLQLEHGKWFRLRNISSSVLPTSTYYRHIRKNLEDFSEFLSESIKSDDSVHLHWIDNFQRYYTSTLSCFLGVWLEMHYI